MLLVVALMGTALAAYGELVSHASQREKEEELLFRGNEYRQAIAAYYNRSPAGHKRYPQSLDELLKDERYLFTQRYLRKLYPDPITGRAEWGLIEAPGGGIMGVYSLSEDAPIKTGNFMQRDKHFADARAYKEWQFFHSPEELVAKPEEIVAKPQ